MHQICAAARKSGIAVVLGFSENDHNSLYIAQCTISPSGAIVMKRRKFKPTHMERTVYGDAGGSSLNNVNEIEGVGRIGALSCWEHMQPLLKYHTISLREEIHVAGWPPVHPHTENNQGLFSMSADGRSFPPCAAACSVERLRSGAWADLPRMCITLPDLRNGIEHLRTALYVCHDIRRDLRPFNRRHILRPVGRWSQRCVWPRWETSDEGDRSRPGRFRICGSEHGYASGIETFRGPSWALQ